MSSLHLVSFCTLWSQASFAEAVGLAVVCDFEITRRAATRAFANVGGQWDKFIGILKRRAELRYERGELLRAERRSLARHFGESVPSLI